jgi:bile acid:Na+ symporter, BASS family
LSYTNAMIKRILEYYTRYYLVGIVVCTVIAYSFPAPFDKFGSYVIGTLGGDFFKLTTNKLFFSLTMFGIGAVLKLDDFVHIAKNPLVILIGTCAQFTIMPLGAYLFTKLFHLDADLAIGLILTGCAPGAMTSNVMCYLARADTAYSVSLTTISTLLCPVLTPVLLQFLVGSQLDVSFIQQFFGLFVTVVLPLLLGVLLRHWLKETMERFLPIFPAISVTFIIFICAYVIARNKSRLSELSIALFATIVCLNIYGMAAGYGVGRCFGFLTQRYRTLSIEIGMQNAGLGVILATTLAQEGKASDLVTLPPVLFVFICIITASGMAAFWQKNERGKI